MPPGGLDFGAVTDTWIWAELEILYILYEVLISGQFNINPISTIDGFNDTNRVCPEHLCGNNKPWYSKKHINVYYNFQTMELFLM